VEEEFVEEESEESDEEFGRGRRRRNRASYGNLPEPSRSENFVSSAVSGAGFGLGFVGMMMGLSLLFSPRR